MENLLRSENAPLLNQCEITEERKKREVKLFLLQIPCMIPSLKNKYTWVYTYIKWILIIS
jgi:hypothetical protein